LPLADNIQMKQTFFSAFSISRSRLLGAFFFAGVLFWIGGFLPDSLSADEESHGVLASGVVHNIAPDRKVEKIGGIMQPEPLDFYLKRLFEDLSKKMDRMDERLQTIEAAVRRDAQPAPSSSVSGAKTLQKK